LKGGVRGENFVDIMIKIHNKIQNIKSWDSNNASWSSLLRKSQAEGLFFFVGVSELLKIICLSKI